MARQAKDGDYEVGRGRPPKTHQFKKGQPTANPYGRGGNPAKKRKEPEPAIGMHAPPRTYAGALADAIIAEANRPLSAKAQPPETILEAFARSFAHKGIKGESAAAQNAYLHALTWSHQLKDREDHEFAVLLKTRKLEGEELLRIAKNNRSPIDLWPHPRDFVLDDLAGDHRIDGPLNDDQRSAEYRFLEYRDAAEKVLEASFRACLDATSDEERNLHREAMEYARDRWTYYNEKVGRRVRRPRSVLYAFDLDRDAFHRDGSVRADYVLPSGKMDRNAFVNPAPPEHPADVERERLEKMHYRERQSIEFDMWICVERCRNATFDDEKERYREELAQLKIQWRKHNAGVHQHDRAPEFLVNSFDPDKPLVEREPPVEALPPADDNDPDYDQGEF